MQDNNADMAAKGRSQHGDQHWSRVHPEKHPRGDDHWVRQKPERITRGERHSNARLTDAFVCSMRERYARGEASQAQLAAEAGVSPTAILLALHRRTWKHV